MKSKKVANQKLIKAKHKIPKSTLSGIFNEKDKLIEEFHLSTSFSQQKRQRKQDNVNKALTLIAFNNRCIRILSI